MKVILRALRIVFAKKKYRGLFFVLFVVMFVINILMLMGAQWLVNGAKPIRIGFLSKPDYVNINGTVIMWIESNYNTQTFWIIYLTPELLVTIIISSLIISLLISELVYITKEIKNKCTFEKSLSSASSIATIIGITSTVSTALTCPSCGATISVTIITLVIGIITGSTLGLSSIIIQLTSYLLWIGIILNIIMLYITSRRLIKLIKRKIF
jgi:hypothetical protein